MAFNNAVNMTSTGMAQVSATGQWSAPTITQFAPVIGTTANGIVSTAAMTNGQVLIGSTGLAPVPASITGGAGITVTPGAGTITISSAGGGTTWNTTAVSIANMAVGNGYFAIAAGGALTFGLPAASVLGDTVRLSLDGATSWQITQAAGQQVRIGSSTTTLGAAGTLTSTAQGDSVELVCRVANTLWVIQDFVGNITVV